MANERFTPGPWKICFDGQIDGSNGKFICGLRFSSYKEFNEDEELKANARLIAAAPKIYKALVELLEHSYDTDPKSKHDPWQPQREAEEALAAINIKI